MRYVSPRRPSVLSIPTKFLTTFSAVCLIAGAATFAQTNPSSAPATQPLAMRNGETEVRFNDGRVAYLDGRFADAEADFRQVIATNPDDADAHHLLGLTLIEEDHADAALKEFDEALRLDPSLNAARAGRASALIKLKRYDEAEPDITALASDPDWKGTADFLRGQIALSKGDFTGASDAFASARESGIPEASAAGFYEGLSRLQLRDLAKARSAFRQAADVDPNSKISIASRQLDSMLASQAQVDKRFHFSLQTGYEYDSNVPLVATGTPLPNNIGQRGDGRFVVQPYASFDIVKNDRWQIGIDTTDYFTWQTKLSNYDVDSYDVGAYVNYMFRKNLYVGVRYDFNYMELGYDPYLTRNLVTPQLTLIEPKFGYTTAYYQYEARQFNGTPPTPQQNRDGDNQVIGAIQGIEVPSFFKETGPAGIELIARYENQSTVGSDYDGDFTTIGFTYRTPLPFWKMRFDAGVALTWEWYDNPNSLDAENHRRHDFGVSTLIGLTKEICTGMSVRVEYSYTNNDSNVTTNTGVDPYSYDRNIVGVRLIMTY